MFRCFDHPTPVRAGRRRIASFVAFASVLALMAATTASANEAELEVPVDRIGGDVAESYVDRPLPPRPGWYFWGSNERWERRERDRSTREREKRWRKRARAAESRARRAGKKGHPHGGPPGQRTKHDRRDRDDEWDDRDRALDRNRRDRDWDDRRVHPNREGGVRIVFDSERGVRIVIDRPGIFYDSGRYFRLDGGGWQVSGNADGDWRIVGGSAVPDSIREAHRIWYLGLASARN